MSQNQLASELEERAIETDANVLAFRFLLERNAHTHQPDTRFQVVLTAFQTLGKSSRQIISIAQHTCCATANARSKN